MRTVSSRLCTCRPRTAPASSLWRTIPPLLWYKVGVNAREKRRIPSILRTLGSLVISQDVAAKIQKRRLFAFADVIYFLKKICRFVTTVMQENMTVKSHRRQKIGVSSVALNWIPNLFQKICLQFLCGFENIFRDTSWKDCNLIFQK